MKIHHCTFMLFILLAGCKHETLNVEKAKERAELLIKEIEVQNYKVISKFYVRNHYKNESDEERIRRFTEIRKALGPLINYRVLEVINQTGISREPKIILKYYKEHEKMHSIETFTIIDKEGEYVIENHSIRSAS